MIRLFAVYSLEEALPDWTKKQERASLARISTLKRALGIPNHPAKTDEFIGHQCHIYTSDEQSATLLEELLYRYGNGRREAFYNAHPEKHTVRDTIRTTPLDGAGYDISVSIISPTHFSKGLQTLIDKYISPDKIFR